jgi:hypothetical protein
VKNVLGHIKLRVAGEDLLQVPEPAAVHHPAICASKNLLKYVDNGKW